MALRSRRRPRPRPLWTAPKPPYHVPSMAEIRATAWNGLYVASLFAGCGGSSLGYRMAGFRVCYANELDEHARFTYAQNADDRTFVDGQDVREVQAEDVLAALAEWPGAPAELDVLDGSPPCQTFSTAGLRKMSDERGELFYEFIRLVESVGPRAFVAENVPGLVRGQAKGHFNRILAGLRATGYRVRVQELDASWLGVPQARKRLIFMGLREDVLPGTEPPFPLALPYQYTVRDALPWIVRHAIAPNWDKWDEDGRALDATMVPSDEPGPTIGARTPSVQVPVGHVEAELVGGHGFAAGAADDGEPRRRSIDEPAPTIESRRQATDTWLVEARLVRPARPGVAHPNWAKEREWRIDDPAPTLNAEGIGGSAPDQVLLEVDRRVVHDTGRPGQEEKDITDEPSPTITVGTADPSEGGGVRSHFKVEERRIVHNTRRPDEPPRDISDEPSPSIMASGGAKSPAHEVETDTGDDVVRRKLTIPELKRLSAFPDDFRIDGKFAEQWARIGNAVPPVMMRTVATALAAALAGEVAPGPPEPEAPAGD